MRPVVTGWIAKSTAPRSSPDLSVTHVASAGVSRRRVEHGAIDLQRAVAGRGRLHVPGEQAPAVDANRARIHRRRAAGGERSEAALRHPSGEKALHERIGRRGR